jgi:hypothetical protein
MVVEENERDEEETIHRYKRKVEDEDHHGEAQKKCQGLIQ